MKPSETSLNGAVELLVSCIQDALAETRPKVADEA